MLDEIISLFGEMIFDDKNRIVFNIGTECKPEGNCAFSDENIPDDETYANIYTSVLKSAISKNAKIGSLMPGAVCTNKKEYDFMIGPNGDIYKCISGVGIDEFKVISKEKLFDNPQLLYINYKWANLLELFTTKIG